MSKRFVAVFLCLLIFVVLLYPVAYAASGDTVVYITRTGERYHDAGCQYLSKSCIETTLQAAVNGGYTPCKVCHPPSLDTAAAFTLPPRPTYSPVPTVFHPSLPSPLPTRPPQSVAQADTSVLSDEDTPLVAYIKCFAMLAGGASVYALHEYRKYKEEVEYIRALKRSRSGSSKH